MILLLWRNPLSSQSLGLVGLTLAVMVAVSVFEGAIHLAKTQPPEGLLSARESSWTPQKEAREKFLLEEELGVLSGKIDNLFSTLGWVTKFEIPPISGRARM